VSDDGGDEVDGGSDVDHSGSDEEAADAAAVKPSPGASKRRPDARFALPSTSEVAIIRSSGGEGVATADTESKRLLELQVRGVSRRHRRSACTSRQRRARAWIAHMCVRVWCRWGASSRTAAWMRRGRSCKP
jgi:hypothetical protein